MPVTDTQLETLFRYFDGELTDAEEQQLMQQLQQDKTLQQAFDQQVLMRTFVPGEQVTDLNDSTKPEPADDFLNRVSSALENKMVVMPGIPVVKRNYQWMAAAAVFTCLLAALLYYLQFKNKHNPIVKIPAKDSSANVKLSLQQQDSVAVVKPEKRLPDSTNLPKTIPPLQQLYADNYTLFPKGAIEVPVEAQAYQDMYEQHRYEELTAQDENDLEVKGQGEPEEEQYVVSCFRFYKALASIAANDLAQAEKLLTALRYSGSGSGSVPLNYPARWYLLMVYLKKGDEKNAVLIIKSLTGNKNNPYYQKAMAVRAVLHK